MLGWDSKMLKVSKSRWDTMRQDYAGNQITGTA